jgi:hypothetical protein
MPKPITAELEPEALATVLRKWAERVTDSWIRKRPPNSPEHHERKGFTRNELVELAETTWGGDDVVRRVLKEAQGAKDRVCVVPALGMERVVCALLKEFGFALGFMHHVRLQMAKDDGFYLNKASGIRERLDVDRKIMVTARMFRKLKRTPNVVAAFTDWHTRKNIAPSNPAFSNFLEASGRYKVLPSAPKESTRSQK